MKKGNIVKEIVTLQKQVKSLKGDVWLMAISMIILMITFTYVISKIDPNFDARVDRGVEFLKGVFDMKDDENKWKNKGIIVC